MERKTGDANPENLCRGGSDGAPGGADAATMDVMRSSHCRSQGLVGRFMGKGN